MKYKVGDKVRVRKDLKGTSAVDSMFKYGGKKATIIKIDCDGAYRLSISPYFYWFNDEMLDPVEDIIEYKGKKYDVVGFIGETDFSYAAMYLTEHKEEILDESEKRYLSAVIKPFRDSVRGIIKRNVLHDYITIIYKVEETPTVLPYFRENTMYKGMELGKEYTVEELGLYEK